jgi:hypothetical protein
MHWTERMVKLCDERGINPAELARMTNLKSKAVYKYFEAGRNGGQGVRNPHGDTVQRIAAVLGLSEQGLRFGNINPPNGFKQIPLLHMNEIGTLTKGQSVLDAWDGVSTVSAPIDISENAIGVNIVDAANEPDFKPGDMVVVEPLISPVPGRFVVAVVNGSESAVFRKYKETRWQDSSVFELIATNPLFPSVPVDEQHPGHIVGVAVAHIRRI